MANFGAHGGYPRWSDAEKALLRELFPATPWPALVQAFPGRTRASIQQMGKNVLRLKRKINRREKWTADENMLLRRIYPRSPDEKLIAALPRHSFIAIQRQASSLGVFRPRPEARSHGRFVHPIIIALYDERCRRRIRRPALAKMIGYAHGQILGWELGKTTPDLAAVTVWAQGLGFEITARKVESVLSVVIAYPGKQRLMGGRA